MTYIARVREMKYTLLELERGRERGVLHPAELRKIESIAATSFCHGLLPEITNGMFPLRIRRFNGSIRARTIYHHDARISGEEWRRKRKDGTGTITHLSHTPRPREVASRAPWTHLERSSESTRPIRVTEMETPAEAESP